MKDVASLTPLFCNVLSVSFVQRGFEAHISCRPTVCGRTTWPLIHEEDKRHKGKGLSVPVLKHKARQSESTETL